jgi:hypothetical protein
MKSWEQQNKLKKESIPTKADLLSRILNNTQSHRDRALVAIAYLTGGRISEIVSEKCLKKTTFAKEMIDGRQRTKKDSLGRFIVERIEKIPLNYKGICKKDITIGMLEDNRKVILVDMQNRKNRTRKRKVIPILYEEEQDFLSIIETYVKELGSVDDPLFPICKSMAWKIISKVARMNCHFLRDIRLTHLVVLYKRDTARLVKYAGWTDGRPASTYVQLDWEDIWK